jgi:hypothetical protein
VQDSEDGCREKEKKITFPLEYLILPLSLTEIAPDKIRKAYRTRLSAF